MGLSFYKMHGIGNDYVYVDCFQHSELLKKSEAEISALAVRISDRHFGVGSDGLILICPSDVADVRMKMYNADGSEGKMCGNGIRCVGKLAYEKGICSKNPLTVETKSGIKTLKLQIKDGNVEQVQVDMGAPILEAEQIPVKGSKGKMVGFPLEIDGVTYPITCVSMGNPHAVIFTSGIDNLDLEKLGPKFERDPIFPESVNTEFVEVIDPHTLRMRVWERGSGETLACGTGACGTVVAACMNGHTPRGEEILVHLRGGDLSIRWDDDSVRMTGPAKMVFSGEISDEID